jgi:hypothetical protein
MMEDVTGRQLNHVQTELVGCYDKLAALLADHGEDLAPFEKRNALKALAALWQVANGLDMDRGHIYDLGA